MKKQKTVLITGATGFIGSHLVKHLVQLGWRVHVIIRSQSNKKTLDACSKSLKFHLTDGSFQSLDNIIKTSGPDVVFHLASLFLADHNPTDIDALFESNLVFSTKLAEAMVQNGVHNLINVGTAWQHYENKGYSPVCLYAATKQAFEDILRYYVEAASLKVTTLKLFDTYGPNDPRKKLVSVMKAVVGTGQTLNMSLGYQKIDLVHIDDVVQALILAATRQQTKNSAEWEIFSINTRHPLTLRGVVKTFEIAAGKKLSVNWGGRPYRRREVMKPWRGASWVPGWKPKIKLVIGFKELLAGK